MSRASPPRPPVDVLAVERLRGTPVEITTPEGVPLPFVVASAGDRAAAFLLDLLLLVAALVVLVVLAELATPGDLGGHWLGAFALLAVFFLRNVYFVWFEVRRGGATPGKRRVGIRVVDAAGGPLRAEAVVARNLMREVEVFLPLAFLFAPGELWPGAPGWARLLSGTWAVTLALMPLFNRRRLRVGDMVAGTLVVRRPRAVLLRDVGREPSPAAPSSASAAAAVAPGYAFQDAQLDVYGIYELQVLEGVLRQGHDPRADRAAVRAVAERIRRKIRWADDVPPDACEPFLRAFYAALRARLEHRMLLGQRKEDKFAR